MRSPVAISNGCAPVWASYSAIISFTSSMSAVAGSYSRSVLSPSDENVRILAFMVGLLRDVNFRFPEGEQSGVSDPQGLYCTVARTCQDSFFRTHDSERPSPRSHRSSPTVDNFIERFRDGMREENTFGNASPFSKARWVKYADDSVWPHLYLPILAPPPIRSTFPS